MTSPDLNGVPIAEPAATAPVHPGVTAPPPGLPGKQSGLALAALIVGIGAFLFGLVPVFGALVGAVGVTLGILALRRQQSKGMAVTGIILGGLAVLASVGMTLGIGAIATYSGTDQKSGVAQPAEPTDIAGSEEADEEEPAEPESPSVPAEYTSALAKAGNYSDLMHMSKVGIYDQLTSEYGEQFSKEAAQYAIDNVNVDWNANALAKAKDYQEQMNMSPAAIRDQLTSEYGEKFTAAEAAYAIDHLND